MCWWAARSPVVARWAGGAAAGAQGRSTRVSGAVPVLLSAVALVAPLLGVDGRHAAVDRSGDHEGRRVIEVVEVAAERDAVVMQHRSPLLYMQQVEGRRPDLTVTSSPFRRLDGEMRGLDLAERYLRDEETVYALDPHPEAVRHWERDGYELRPVEEDLALYEVAEQ